MNSVLNQINFEDNFIVVLLFICGIFCTIFPIIFGILKYINKQGKKKIKVVRRALIYSIIFTTILFIIILSINIKNLSNDAKQSFIEIVVLDKNDKVKISQAIVTFSQSDFFCKETTNYNGKIKLFLAKIKQPITAQLKIEHPLYQTYRETIIIENLDKVFLFYLQKHPQISKIAIENSKYILKGRIIDEDGEPIAGAKISVMGGLGEGISNYDGNFSFPVKAKKGEEVKMLIQKNGYKNKNIYHILLGSITIMVSKNES